MPARPRLTVPKNWTHSIQAALVHVISLAQYALVYARSWAGSAAPAGAVLPA